MCKFKSSSVGNTSKISFGNTFDISYELTPIGLLISLNEYSTENFVFSLHNIIPIVGLSLSVLIKSSTADK